MNMRFRINIILCACLLLLSASACKRNSFTICGTIDGGAGKTLWLEEIAPDGPVFIDSIPLDSKGHFKYTYKMPYRSMFNLHVSENNFIVTLPDYGEKVEVNGSWESLSTTYSVKGSPESLLLWQLQQYTNDGVTVLNRLIDTTEHYSALLAAGMVDESVTLAKKDETDSIYRETFREQQDLICHFIEENKGSLSTLIALYKPFNNRPLLNPQAPNTMDYFDMVLEGLEETMPDNPHTAHFKITTEHLRSAVMRQQEQEQ